MCGIVGCVGRVFKKEEEAFINLLQLDTLRGPHSTGVLSVSNKKIGWEYLKSVGTPWDLFATKEWRDFFSPVHKALIGHNRWATVGKITQENAHPFAHGDFIGVHNGTLKSKTDLPGGGEFETDSEAIINCFNNIGVEETIKKLNGAFALAWYDHHKGLIQLCRNKERPLYICASEDGLTHFWASEAWMINVSLSKAGIKHTVPTMIEEGVLVSINTERRGVDPVLPVIKKISMYEPVVTYHTYGWRTEAPGGERKVIPFVKRKDGESLKTYLGKQVMFSVAGQGVANGMDFISCLVEETNGPEVRVFVPKTGKLAMTLLGSRNYFSGKVKKISDGGKGHYLLLDNRTIKEIEDDGDDLPFGTAGDADAKEYLIYGGLKVSLQEWYRNTEKGCSWCSEFPRVQEHKDLHWFAHGQFLCKDCQKNEEVMSYVAN